jgi:hypothetical protein
MGGVRLASIVEVRGPEPESPVIAPEDEVVGKDLASPVGRC